MKTLHLLLPALVCSGLACHDARADMQWTEVIKLDSGQPGGPANMAISTTKWAKKDAQRSETSMKLGPITMTNAEITRCDEGQTYQLLPDQKVYAVAPLTPGGGLMPQMPSMGGRGGFPGMGGRPDAAKLDTPETGTSAIDTKLKDLGTEKIIGIDTKHYEVDMTVTSTGCAGTDTKSIVMETWVADIPTPVPCLALSPEDASKMAAHLKASCDVKTTFTGDVTGMKQAFSGFLMKMKVSTGKGSGFTKEVTMLSRAELPDAPFSLGEDWKKVSDSEFQQAKQRAMMKSLMGGAGR